MKIETTLKRVEVFLGLDDRDLSRIASLPSCHEETFQPGETIFRKGDEAKYLYVLKDGQVDLVMEIPASSKRDTTVVVVDRVTTGGFFGWSALVRPHLYALSSVCSKPSTAVMIGGADLLALFEKDHGIGYRVFESLSHVIGARLRDIEQALVKGQRWPFVGDDRPNPH